MKHLFLAAVFLCGILCFNSLYGQKEGQEAIDSLLKDLPQKKEDTDRVELLDEISMKYVHINPDEGIKYGLQGLELATRLGWKKGIAQANNRLGVNYKIKSDYHTALDYFQRALRLFEEAGDAAGIAVATRSIGTVYELQSDNAKALNHYFKALKIYEANGDKLSAALLFIDIGNIYDDYSRGLDYYFKALKIYEELGSKLDIAGVMVSIARVYQVADDSLKDYGKAIAYNLKALKIFEELNHKYGLATIFTNMGDIYSSKKNRAMAIEYEKIALKLFNGIGNKYGASATLYNIGAEYLQIVKDKEAGVANMNAEVTLSRDVNELPVRKYLSDNAIPATKAGLLHDAIGYLQKSLEMSKEINAMDVMQNCYQGLMDAYKLKGDYKMALECSDNFRAIRDSVFSLANNEQIEKIGLKNEYDRRRLADSLKTAEKEKVSALKLQRQRSYTLMGIAGVILLLGFSFFIVKERKKSEQERRKSDELLLNILPGEVANELKANGSTTAKHFENVTVLFTDFVNFTHASERMGPQQLIDELHDCFKKFDEITANYKIEKIKTIGDAYLAVAGLPMADDGHAEQTIKAAIEICAFMQDRVAKLGDRTFPVRIGVHSGNVVAGIVGVKKFAYDVWGDTVNTAARMEQHGEAGKINISQATYELVKDKFRCEYRGEIDAKNKGKLSMYFIG